MKQVKELKSRLHELEIAAHRLVNLLEKENSAFHNDEFLKLSLTKVLKEQTNIRRKLEELKNV
jgi:hypothetical protein